MAAEGLSEQVSWPASPSLLPDGRPGLWSWVPCLPSLGFRGPKRRAGRRCWGETEQGHWHAAIFAPSLSPARKVCLVLGLPATRKCYGRTVALFSSGAGFSHLSLGLPGHTSRFSFLWVGHVKRGEALTAWLRPPS